MVESYQKRVLKALNAEGIFEDSTVQNFLKIEKYRLKKGVVAASKRTSMLFTYINNRCKVQKEQEAFKRLALCELETIQNNSSSEEVKKYCRMLYGFHSQDCTVKGLEYEKLQALIDKIETSLLRNLREKEEVKNFLKAAVLYSRKEYNVEDFSNLNVMISMI
jgi:ATP-dependent helicase/DNAse subunit B